MAHLVGDTFRCWWYSFDSLCRTKTGLISLCSTTLAVLHESTSNCSSRHEQASRQALRGDAHLLSIMPEIPWSQKPQFQCKTLSCIFTGTWKLLHINLKREQPSSRCLGNALKRHIYAAPHLESTKKKIPLTDCPLGFFHYFALEKVFLAVVSFQGLSSLY